MSSALSALPAAAGRTALAVFVVTSVLSPLPSKAAPTVSVDARAGGQFGGDLSEGDDTASLDASAAYTFGLSYWVREDARASVWYGVQPTTLRVDDDLVGDAALDAQLHHVMVGGSVDIPTGGIARPFVELGLGAAVLNVSEANAGTETRFAMSVGGGLLIEVTDWLWLRAQIDLRLAFLGGGSLFCGVGSGGGGCLVSVNEVFPQGNASGGLMINF